LLTPETLKRQIFVLHPGPDFNKIVGAILCHDHFADVVQQAGRKAIIGRFSPGFLGHILAGHRHRQRMLPEFDHFKILEQKCFGQGIDNRNRNDGITDRIKAQQNNCIFHITDFGSKTIKYDMGKKSVCRISCGK